MIPYMGHTPGLGQRNTLPTATVMAPLSFFQSLGASRSSGPEWARSCETDSSPRVTSHSGPPLDRGVSASLLSDREGSRPIFICFWHALPWAQTNESCVQSMTEEAGGASPGIAGESQGRGPPGGHASLRSFENAVPARLPHPGNASTLGCELQFVQMNSLQVLADSIQSAICTNQKCCAIAEQCMVEAGHKRQLKGKSRQFGCCVVEWQNSSTSLFLLH